MLQVLPRLGAGGVERGTVEVAAALVEAGGTAVVASEGGALEYELRRAGAQHVTLPLASKNPIVMRRNVARLVRVIEELDVDIVHARSRAPAWSAAAAARRSGRHFVTTFHGTYDAGNPLRRRYNAIMTRGERVIAISNHLARHIRETYPVDPARIRVIPRGVDIGRFDPDRVSAERVIALATRWRLPDGVPLVMLPGRLTRWKGQAVLLQALTALRDLDLVCALVGADQGHGAYRRELEQMVVDLDLAGRAFLFDHCEDMPAAYMLSDVVVSASLDPEGFGRVVAEAKAMGRPVVVSNHGGAAEQIVPGLTGFLHERGDPESLAAAIRTALSLSPEERAYLAQEAIASVRSHFTREQMCARTLGLYQELLRSAAYQELPDAVPA